MNVDRFKPDSTTWSKLTLFLCGIIVSGAAAYISLMKQSTEQSMNINKNTESLVLVNKSVQTNQAAITELLGRWEEAEKLAQLRETAVTAGHDLFKTEVLQRVEHYGEETERIQKVIESTQTDLKEQGKAIQKIEIGVTRIEGNVSAIREDIGAARKDTRTYFWYESDKPTTENKKEQL